MSQEKENEQEVNVPGIIGIILFYLLIVVIGMWAAWKKRNSGTGVASETVIVAGRDIGLFVGCFTMTATWVGGGYINGTAEYVYGYGLVQTHAPWGYAVSLILGGILFAKKMRSRGYVTMFDPIQRKLGENMGALLYLPALLAELFWSAAILSALGGSLKVIIGLERWVAVVVSAAIAVMYTFIGGLYSVAYTDIVQLICIFIGLWISIPFALTNPATGNIWKGATHDPVGGPQPWLGEWNVDRTGEWIDVACMLIFGGIPWQVYFQRVLSAKSARHAQLLSFVAAAGCVVMAVPSVLIGAIASATRWNETSYASEPTNSTMLKSSDIPDVLPIVLQHLTPVAVSVIGLGSVSAAVMSSADSSILSVSSVLLHNVYQKIFRRNKASEFELIWVMRLVIIVMGGLAAVLAIFFQSVYVLWYLCSDLLYVILFPQLLCVFYFDPNTYGSLVGYIVGFVLRLGGGEPSFGYTGFITYPGNDENQHQFPFKTFAMLISLATTLMVSHTAKWLFESSLIPSRYDVFGCDLAFGGRALDEKPGYEDPIQLDDLPPHPPVADNDEEEESSQRTGVDNAVFKPEEDEEEKTAM